MTHEILNIKVLVTKYDEEVVDQVAKERMDAIAARVEELEERVRDIYKQLVEFENERNHTSKKNESWTERCKWDDPIWMGE